MTAAQSARIAIVVYSLGITGALLLFFLLAQPFQIRFDYEKGDHLRLVDVILPVFLGYLGAASHFIFNANRGREVAPENERLLKILVHGTFLFFIAFMIALFVSFQISRLPAASGLLKPSMEIGELTRWVSIALGLMTAVVSVIASYLFGAPPRTEREPNSPASPAANRTNV